MPTTKHNTGNIISGNVVLASQSVVTRVLNGESYVVAPVVILTVGVHEGIGPFGPIYYPPEVLSAMPSLWNDVPLPIGHPMADDGTLISCNQPHVLERCVGVLKDVKYKEGKLVGDLWIHLSKAQAIAPSVLTELQQGRLEVSTGMYMEVNRIEGVWNGEQYAGVARSIWPDHLALLPGGVGACSWSDGCGAPRVNSANPGSKEIEKGGDVMTEGQGGGLFKNIYHSVRKFFSANEEFSHDEKYNKLQNEVDKLDTQQTIHVVKDVYDDFVVYASIPRSGGGERRLFKREYTIAADGAVQLAADTIEVRERHQYVPVGNEATEEEKEPVKAPLEQSGTVINEGKEAAEMSNLQKCCPERVKQLIANSKGVYTDADKEALELLTEGQLALLERSLTAHNSPEPGDGAVKAPEPKKEDKVDGAGADVGNKPPAASPPVTAEQYVNNAPSGVRESLQRLLDRDKEYKDKLVAHIKSSPRNRFSDEQLVGMSIDHLERVAEMVQVEVSYAGNGPGRQPVMPGGNPEADLAPLVAPNAWADEPKK